MKYGKTFIVLFVIAFFTGQLHGGWHGIADSGFNTLMFVVSILTWLGALGAWFLNLRYDLKHRR